MVYRIPDSFVEELLSRVDIVEIISRQVSLRKAGAHLVGLCPFHGEKTPSFSVNAAKQFYYCFGCHKHGDAIQFLIESEGSSFTAVIESLAASYGLALPMSESDRTQIELENTLLQVLHTAASYYQQQLRVHPASPMAVAYLKQRGLNGVLAKHYGLGFAPPGWDGLIKRLNPTDAQIGSLQQVGLLVQDQKGHHYDRFRNRIMFPIYDRRGRVIGFGGRVLLDEEPKYLNSPESLVFHKGHELYGLYQVRRNSKTADTLIVVEGYMDVLALAQFDIHNAVATLGTALTEKHIETLFQATTDMVFCFDGDKAGVDASARALHLCIPKMRDGLRVRFVQLPGSDDPDSYIRKNGREGFLEKIEKASSLGDFLFSSMSQNINFDHLEDRVKFGTLLKPLLNKLPKGLYQQMMYDKLASAIGVARSVIFKEEKPVSKKLKDYARPLMTPAMRACVLLVHRRSLLAFVDGQDLEQVNYPDVGLFAKIVRLLQHDPMLSLDTLLAEVHTQAGLSLSLEQIQAIIPLIPEEGMEQEFIGALKLIRRQKLETAMECLVEKSRQGLLTSVEKTELKNLLHEMQILQSAVA